MTTALPAWLLETWIEYAISVSVALVRLGLRTRVVGLRGWQGDDYFVCLAVLFFTLDVTCFQIIQRLGTNIGLTSEGLSEMTPSQISDLRTGSILNFVSWYTWSGHLWSCKACMLFLYSRLTMGLWQRNLFTFTTCAVALTFVGGWLANTFKCFPVQKNWQVSPPPGNCPAGAANLFFTGTTNFITDLLILSIPIPILHLANLTLKKKLLVTAIFGSGILIVIVSGCRFVFSVLAVYGIGPADLGFRLGWTARENSTSLIIVNIPVIFSSIQRLSRPPPGSTAAYGYGGSTASRTRQMSRQMSMSMSKGTTLIDESMYQTEHPGLSEDVIKFRSDPYTTFNKSLPELEEEENVISRPSEAFSFGNYKNYTDFQCLV